MPSVRVGVVQSVLVQCFSSECFTLSLTTTPPHHSLSSYFKTYSS